MNTARMTLRGNTVASNNLGVNAHPPTGECVRQHGDRQHGQRQRHQGPGRWHNVPAIASAANTFGAAVTTPLFQK
jgi:hypothetical protein